MTTMINGEPALWPEHILALWRDKTSAGFAGVEVICANYFQPRPYVDQYNRGSKKAGFTFTTSHLSVGQISWIPLD